MVWVRGVNQQGSRRISAFKVQGTREWQTYTKGEVKCKGNTPKISGSERKPRARNKVLDCSVISDCSIYAAGQPKLQRGVLTILNGAHHDTPSRQKQNTTHGPPEDG